MKKEKAERIIRIYNWARLIIIILFLAFVFIGVASAQTVEERVTKLEQLIQQQSEKNKYKPER